MTHLVEVPYDLAHVIDADQNRNTWTWYADSNAFHWAATPYHYDGEQVMLLLDDGDGLRPAIRSSVEAAYGPLTEVLHCTRCGDYFWYKNGVCRTVTCANPAI